MVDCVFLVVLLFTCCLTSVSARSSIILVKCNYNEQIFHFQHILFKLVSFLEDICQRDPNISLCLWYKGLPLESYTSTELQFQGTTANIFMAGNWMETTSDTDAFAQKYGTTVMYSTFNHFI